MIYLTNADHVTFDGINDGSNQLTIENTSTTGSTVVFKDGASNDNITNCNIYGSGIGSSIIDFRG